MLPKDLAFTLFSVSTFERDLRLSRNHSSIGEKANEAFVGVFIPAKMDSCGADLEAGKEVIYDSILGFSLYIVKDSNETFCLLMEELSWIQSLKNPCSLRLTRRCDGRTSVMD